ncbi:hypothetical protein LTR36_007070 [Oleoguttula mirabilis]|uniref:RING-type domain-containing protein n=1 Tax=Oleoguttula mirabilis TaxID=1507867 RepID=A0AAV9JAJ7_9PEZI|nr:hypothetical protein LTR36_007070 [Oleoguttula mirabilis]
MAMSLDKRDIEILNSLREADIPRKIRCSSCSGLAVNPAKLLCCDEILCGACQATASDKCLTCGILLLSSGGFTPNKSLRTTAKAFLRTQRAKRNLHDAHRRNVGGGIARGGAEGSSLSKNSTTVSSAPRNDVLVEVNVPPNGNISNSNVKDSLPELNFRGLSIDEGNTQQANKKLETVSSSVPMIGMLVEVNVPPSGNISESNVKDSLPELNFGGLSIHEGKIQQASKKPETVSPHATAERSDKLRTPLRTCRLLCLPGELQDIMFDFAYPAEAGVKYVDRKQWETSERNKRRADPAAYTPRDFPAVTVERFLACKAFFVAASRAWVRNQAFNAQHSQAFSNISWGRVPGIVGAFVVTLEARLVMSVHNDLHQCESVRDLQLEVPVDAFEVLEPKFAWVEELDEDDLDRVLSSTTLSQLRGLRTLKLTPGYCSWADTENKVKMWDANVHRLEDCARRSAMKARVSSRPLGVDRVLYIGSKVRFVTPPTEPTQSQPRTSASLDPSSISTGKPLDLQEQNSVSATHLSLQINLQVQRLLDAHQLQILETRNKILTADGMQVWIRRQVAPVLVHVPVSGLSVEPLSYKQKWYGSAVHTLTMKYRATESARMLHLQLQQVLAKGQNAAPAMMHQLDMAMLTIRKANEAWNSMIQGNERMGRMNGQALQTLQEGRKAPPPRPESNDQASTVSRRLDELSRINEAEVMKWFARKMALQKGAALTVQAGAVQMTDSHVLTPAIPDSGVSKAVEVQEPAADRGAVGKPEDRALFGSTGARVIPERLGTLKAAVTDKGKKRYEPVRNGGSNKRVKLNRD